MALAYSKVTAQGQISVPADIRRKLGLEPGAVLEWTEERGKIVVQRAARSTWEDIHHALFPDGVPPKRTLAEMKAGIGRHIRERHARD
jgi:AbrB family looped-hinge helix DNA binding protein